MGQRIRRAIVVPVLLLLAVPYLVSWAAGMVRGLPGLVAGAPAVEALAALLCIGLIVRLRGWLRRIRAEAAHRRRSEDWDLVVGSSERLVGPVTRSARRNREEA